MRDMIYAQKKLAHQVYLVSIRGGILCKRAICGRESPRSWQLLFPMLFSEERVCKNCRKKETQNEIH